MKNKYIILLVLSTILIYTSLSYFSKAGLPLKAFLTLITSLVFFRDCKSCEDSFYIMVPSLWIGYILSIMFKTINPEWFLFLGFILYFLIVYIYSYTKKILIRKISSNN